MLITKCNSAAKNERAQVSAKPSCMGVIIRMFPKLAAAGKKKNKPNQQPKNPPNAPQKPQQKQKRQKTNPERPQNCDIIQKKGIKADGEAGVEGASAVAPQVCPVCSR